MDEQGVLSVAERFRRVAGAFTERVRQVPGDAWDRPAPCEGWVARDVVAHMVEWMPGFLRNFGGVEAGPVPSVDADPLAAWVALADALQRLLDDPRSAAIEMDVVPAGRRCTLEQAVADFFLGDVLIHTWDLARAVGLDETLDPDEVRGMYEGMLPMDAALRASGHFGPRVEVGDDASEQDRLLAFVGRDPH